MLVFTIENVDLKFEHSLVSLKEWEGFYEKPFFSDKEDEAKTVEEYFKYFECMLLPKSFKHRHLIEKLTADQHVELSNYIAAPHTATIVRDIPGRAGPRENVTAELIYYWLTAFKIPFYPTDTWHLNNTLTLVKVCGVKNAPATKRSRNDMIQDYRKRNEENRRRLGTTG